MKAEQTLYHPKNKVRFVTAASLFDGHDASINIIRRLLQARGAEVVHLGHNRAVSEIVTAAIQEDAQAIAVSSYQGGHNEFFRYLVDLLRERGASHIRVFGGGGGVIVPREIRELETYGVTRIYSPEDGRVLGLAGMIDDMLRSADFPLPPLEGRAAQISSRDRNSSGKLARLLTQAESNGAALHAAPTAEPERRAAVLGITGTGGAGKSSLTDELVRRFLIDSPDLPIAILSVDPTKRKTGGALLGDRIRMNAIEHENVYMRSLATRGSGSELPKAIENAIEILRSAGFRLVMVETSGIGQGSSAIADVADLSLYVMTPEYGAPSQLEKIDMLDFADVVAINKFDRRGGEDALRDVRKQFRRGKQIGYDIPDAELPVFGTIASQFGDRGVTALYQHVLDRLRELDPNLPHSGRSGTEDEKVPRRKAILPENRERYLGEITEVLRKERARIEEEVALARKLYQLEGASTEVEGEAFQAKLRERARALRKGIRAESLSLLDEWPAIRERYAASEVKFEVREREIAVESTTTSLSGSRVPKVSVPRFEDWGEILRFRLQENLPGFYPFTAGVFPFKRDEEAPRRQFAGEGGPSRTNQRFHYLSRNDSAKRLSTAFDSVTLYGEDPGERPDIYGKIGEGGVSIATLDDMKVLYQGFDLTDAATSVSMTINGPAPAILAMFFNTAIDREMERFERERGRKPDAEEAARVRRETLSTVRGTVQADILKEDQAQNTCIFSTDFALRLMGDVQQFFIDNSVRNFYSVSISGYHIAEAGANPITQLAFTLANGFTYVEYYLAPGNACRRLRPEPFVLLQQRPRPGVLGPWPRRAPNLGPGDEGPLWRERAQPEIQVPHPDLRPLAPRAGDPVQRHPHHAPGADRGLRPLQFSAYQRLRRGDYHPHHGVRSARDGHPADHPERVRDDEEREPAPGVLFHRRADRARGGSGARRVRPPELAGRGPRGDRAPVSAEPHPGGVPPLRAEEGQRRASHRRSERVSRSRGKQSLRGTEGDRARAGDEGREGRPDTAPRRVPRKAPRGTRGRSGEAQKRREDG